MLKHASRHSLFCDSLQEAIGIAAVHAVALCQFFVLQFLAASTPKHTVNQLLCAGSS